jgi:glycerol-3-phosphate dehydrogenase
MAGLAGETPERVCYVPRVATEFWHVMGSPVTDSVFDLLVVGGGINGAGIARDATGRGLKVLLVERDDLASATSSASSKLIHGGLRYLEYYEFRLVREALAEREVLLRVAPHIIWPMRFVLPHAAHLRPAWMIRMGLWLYDHLGGRTTLPGSRSLNLRRAKEGDALRDDVTKGFVYSDCWVDDARLVALNARDAVDRGAVFLPRTALLNARRVDGLWSAEIERQDGQRETVRARAIVNAAGPWAADVLGSGLGINSARRLRLIKGSHIIVKRLYEGPHAYILQNEDRRIVFVLPYEQDYTLIGTTDVPFTDDPRGVKISPEETSYLCTAVSRWLAKTVTPDDVVWSYAGVRPLYDDGSTSASAVTRDYVLEVENQNGQAPVLSVFGGKITTFRRLAEHALDKLAPYFPAMTAPWTDTAPLPGGELENADFERFFTELQRRRAWIPTEHLRALARRHGKRLDTMLTGCASLADLGQHFGKGLYAREIDWLVAQEWAMSADDILFRRTKFGLHLDAPAREAVATYFQQKHAHTTDTSCTNAV